MKLLLVIAAALLAVDGCIDRPAAARRGARGLREFPDDKVGPGERPEAALIRKPGQLYGAAGAPL
jgi:hypothetical protein